MFTRFDEAGRRRERRRWVGVVSVVGHVAVVWLAAAVTRPVDAKTPPERIIVPIYVPPSESPAEQTPEPPRESRGGEPVTPREPGPPAPTVPVPPVVIGDGVPPIGDPVPTPEEILGGVRGAARGDAPAGGVEPGDGSGPGGAWTGSAVDVEVVARPGNSAPRYPVQLERLGVAGRVIARFVVDTAGRVEAGSVTIVASDHDAFADAVRRALPRYRFEPARVRGGRVRQLVEMPFVFEVRP